jgi:hypothetical protein
VKALRVQDDNSVIIGILGINLECIDTNDVIRVLEQLALVNLENASKLAFLKNDHLVGHKTGDK